MDLREVGCDPGDWIALAEDRDCLCSSKNQWWVCIRAIINFQYYNILKIKV